MSIFRAQISVPVDTALPKDRMVITPHFKVTLFANAQSIADDLSTAMQTYLRSTATEVDVKLYDAEDPGSAGDPHPPVAVKKRGSDPLLAGHPRELAVCLSYYADDNVPRRRGRIYIPFAFIYRSQTSPSPPLLRPNATDQSAGLALATAFKALGGVDTDWVVWSRVANEAHSVTNYYVDDEWDIQRRRGGRPTSRAVGTGA